MNFSNLPSLRISQLLITGKEKKGQKQEQKVNKRKNNSFSKADVGSPAQDKYQKDADRLSKMMKENESQGARVGFGHKNFLHRELVSPSVGFSFKPT